MEPEEDFDSWINLANELCMDGDQFRHFMPGFTRIFESIRDTGFLPATSTDPDSFIRGLIPRIVLKLLEINKPSRTQNEVIFHFFQLCLKLSLVGFCTGDSTMVSLATNILGDNACPVYSSGRKQLYQKLCQFYISSSAMEIMLEFMTERCQSFEFFNQTLLIFSTIFRYNENFSFRKIAPSIANAIDRLLDANLTTNGFIKLTDSLKHFRQIMPLSHAEGDYFVECVAPILAKFIPYKTFDHRRIFFSILQLMINDKYLTRKTADFINMHQEIMENFSFHVEFAEAISDIMCGLAKESLLSNETIRKVWSMHSSRHETEIDAYIDMFAAIAETAKDECLEEVINCITTSDNSNPVWFRTVDKLISVLSEGNKQREINLIRKKLWEIAFDKNHPLIATARKSLLDFIGKQADYAIFNMLVCKERESRGDIETVIFCFRMLREIMLPKLKLSHNAVIEVINECFDYILTTSPIPDEFFEFIEVTYKSLKMQMEPEYIEKIMQLRNKTDKFYPFINTLCDYGVLSPDLMTTIAVSVPKEEHDQGFLSFIQHMMEKLNYNQATLTVSKLPLINEDLIWRLAIDDSPVREDFEKLLCSLYFSNDGDILTDEEMINKFLERWSKEQEVSNYDPKYINLLIRFISEIEDATVTDSNHRMPDKMEIHVNGICKEKDFNTSFEVGSDATIGYVASRIARIRDVKLSTILLFYNNREVGRTRKAIDFVEPGTDSVSFEIRYRTAKKGKKVHEREVLPSEVISKTEHPDKWYMRLHNKDELMYKLLNMLPTVSSSHTMLLPIFKGEIPMNVFNLEDPYFFLYNMTTLDNYFNDDARRGDLIKQAKEHNFSSFFIDCINAIIDSNLITQYVYSEITYEILRFFQNITPVEADVLTHLFFTLVRLASQTTDKLLLTHIKKTIDFSFKEKKKAIDFPGADFIPCFNMLLTDNKYKRAFAKQVFDALKIPIHVFTETIVNLGNNITDEFLDCFNSHFNDFNETEDISALANNLFNLINESDLHLNAILKSFDVLLQFAMLPADFLPVLTRFLINKFFIYDMNKQLKLSFMNAVLCLINLCDVVDPVSKQLLLHNALIKHHVNIHPFSSFSTRLDNCLISEAGKVGLTNLGATCYMESSLQQFFAIPAIRDEIINYRGSSEVLTELSHLFTRMLYSTGKAESLSGLVKHFKWWGTDLNPREQQDAVEFIEILLSTYLMENPDVGPRIKKLCQGQMNYHVDGIGVDYHTINSQDFSCVELEINSDTDKLEDCIANYNHANYFTEQTGQYNTDTLGKINATRRCFIDLAPPVLIIHLKRFAYDYTKQQRIKISTPLEIPLTLDISLAAECPHEPYKLNGVVVHRGINALGGHYVSYTAREDGQWTLFNDEEVSIVSESKMLKEVNGSETSVGYILFYVLDDVMKETQIYPDENVKRDVEKKNEENKLKTLYFTDPYFDLMQALSSRVMRDYDDVIQLFTIDMLPYSQFGSRCSDFMNNVSRKATSLFVETLNEEYFRACIFDCPHEQYRSGFCKILEKSLTEENCEPIFEAAFKLVNCVLSDYGHLDSVFHVLYSILSINESTFSKYADRTSARIFSFLLEDIVNYLAAHDSLKRSYFFGGIDISYILKICAKFDDVIPELKNDAFLIDIASSGSSSEAIAEYAKKFYSEEQFIQFIKTQAMTFKPHKLFSLLTCALPDICVSFFLSLTIQKIKGDDADHDRSTEIAICAANNPETRQAIINHRDEWLERFLIHDNPSVRQNAQAIVSHIIGDKSLKILSSVAINQEMFIQQPLFHENKDKDEIQRLTLDFINSIMKLIPKLEKYLTSDAKAFKNSKEQKPIRANELLELLEALLKLSPQQVNLKSLTSLITPICALGSFSTALTKLMSIYSTYKVVVNGSVLILCIKGAKFSVKKTRQINDFIEAFLPTCKIAEGVLPDEVVSFFLSQIAFQKTKNIKKAFPVIKDFLIFLCKSPQKSLVLQYIETKLKVSCEQNLTNVCIALSTLDQKLDVYQYLEEALKEDTLIPQEELIRLVVKCNSRQIKRPTIAAVVDLPELTKEARQVLLELVP